MAKPVKNQHPSLEREVIFSVTILYVLICVGVVAIHYLQPVGQETVTSSTSPSHESLRADDLTGAVAPALTQVEVHTLLIRQGYQEIRGLRADDQACGGDDTVIRAKNAARSQPMREIACRSA